MSLSFSFNHSDFSDEVLNRSIQSIMESNPLMSVATISEGSRSHIHTAYYAFNSRLELYSLTEPFTQHSMNVKGNSSVAVAVYDSRQPWDEPKRGLQLFGECKMAQGAHLAEAFLLYARRFSGLKQWVQHADDILKNVIESRFYVISVDSIKIFDEPRLGAEIWVSVKVPRNAQPKESLK